MQVLASLCTCHRGVLSHRKACQLTGRACLQVRATGIKLLFDIVTRHSGVLTGEECRVWHMAHPLLLSVARNVLPAGTVDADAAPADQNGMIATGLPAASPRAASPRSVRSYRTRLILDNLQVMPRDSTASLPSDIAHSFCCLCIIASGQCRSSNCASASPPPRCLHMHLQSIYTYACRSTW